MQKFHLYIHSKNCRFVLGNKTSNPLLCIGINPSTATDEKPDSTIRKIQKITDFNQYNGFIMLNLFPLISRSPSHLPNKIIPSYHQENLKHIKTIFALYEQKNILACWGNNIATKAYLWEILLEIYTLSNKAKWWHLGDLTKEGNPRHPLYSKIEKLQAFDIQKYLHI